MEPRSRAPDCSPKPYQTQPLLGVIVGVVALVASSKVKDEAIDIVLAVLCFLAGGLGGVLVAIGGIWAIISRYTLKGHA